MRDLAPQVDELLLVHNGGAAGREEPPEPDDPTRRIRSIGFGANRGTAAAWNAALAWALEREYRYLYLLDQDSAPGPTAVGAALRQAAGGAAAVVQPARPDVLGLDPFPWNTVASGSLLDAAAVQDVGGFDERLFVDEVDHELFDRLTRSGYPVEPLPEPTIAHQTGSPRRTRFLGRPAVVSGHSADRRRVQGFSAGVVARRYARAEPATSARLLLRHLLTAAKDASAGERTAARSLTSGLLEGLATARLPEAASGRSCPYCRGPLLGRFAQVPDWRFGAGPPADVYWCARCGALAAGRVPADDEVASWYSGYYTHAPEPGGHRMWSRVWPRPARRQEMDALRRYLTTPGETGRFLDVGTGSGERLVELADAGWEVVGQDLDPEAGHVARGRGIPVHHRPVSALVGEEPPFDLIGLTHVLEHAAEPAELLAACAALLAPGGRICVVAPNARGLGRRLFGRWWFGLEQPRHLAIPTVESLCRLAGAVGLETVEARTAAANAAVVLGGSLARGADAHLPAGPVRTAADLSLHVLGQAMGRAAVLAGPGLGEEVVWVGRRR